METFQELVNSKTPLLVDFYADWCGPCKMMSPILKELAGEMGDRLRIIKIDVDKNPQASNAFSVQGVPTLILFQGGQQLWRQSGVVQTRELAKIINSKIST